MDTLTGLLKEHQVGEWCKRAAWIIAAIGLVEIVLDVYNLISLQQQDTMSYTPFTGRPSMVLLYLVQLFPMIAQIFFFFFALYAAGVFLNHFVANTQDDNEEEDDELIAEEEGYLKPGQFTEIP